MKVPISTDAEGITGIFRKSQVTPVRPDYGQFRNLMAHDVDATIHGVFAGRATEVMVNDSHDYDDNVLPVDLDPWASLMFGTDKPLIMAEGLTEQVDALMLVGYHSREGAKGIISHTYYYPIVMDAVINGVSLGEVEFVSHVAGYYGVSTVLFAGDDYVTASAEKRIPGIHTAVVKKVIGNGSAQLYYPEKTGKLTEEAVKAAVSEYRIIVPVKLEGPIISTITFAAMTRAVHACKVPGFTLSKEQDNVVNYTRDNYSELHKAFSDASWQAVAFDDQC